MPKQNHRQSKSINPAPYLWGAAVVFCCLAVWNTAIFAVPVLVCSMIIVLAIICERRPVHFAREGIALSLSMPLLIGLLVIGGPIFFIIGDALVCFLSWFLQNKSPVSKRAKSLLLLNFPICIISSSLASAAFVWLQLQSSSPRTWVFASLLAVVVYELSNFIAVVLATSMKQKRSVVSEILRGATGMLIGTIFLALVALATSALIHEDRAYLMPVLLIPIFILRNFALRLKEIDDAGYETMVTLTMMLQRAHPYSHGHLGRVGLIAEEVGFRLGISRKRARLLREAAVLHDIGKIAIDEEVLNKPAKLTDEEYEHVKLHAAFGAEILQGSKLFQEIVPWIRFHHERPDGKGYPSKLSGQDIPLESKIISVADAFDAMVGDEQEDSQRSYRTPKTVEQGLAELERCSGTQFDAEVVFAFKEVIQSAT